MSARQLRVQCETHLEEFELCVEGWGRLAGSRARSLADVNSTAGAAIARRWLENEAKLEVTTVRHTADVGEKGSSSVSSRFALMLTEIRCDCSSLTNHQSRIRRELQCQNARTTCRWFEIRGTSGQNCLREKTDSGSTALEPGNPAQRWCMHECRQPEPSTTKHRVAASHSRLQISDRRDAIASSSEGRRRRAGWTWAWTGRTWRAHDCAE